jgi:hypothetical protein
MGTLRQRAPGFSDAHHKTIIMGAFGRTVTANAWLTGLESARQSIILQVVTPRNAYQDHLTPFSSKGMASIQIGEMDQDLRVGESDPVLRGADSTQCRNDQLKARNSQLFRYDHEHGGRNLSFESSYM